MGVPGPVTSGLSAGVHELLRGEGVLVTDAAEVAELVGDIGDLAPDRRGPVLAQGPAGSRQRHGCSKRCPAVARPTAARGGPRLPGPTTDEALGRLYELHSLGFVERHGDGWQLTPQRRRRGSNARRGGP